MMTMLIAEQIRKASENQGIRDKLERHKKLSEFVEEDEFQSCESILNEIADNESEMDRKLFYLENMLTLLKAIKMNHGNIVSLLISYFDCENIIKGMIREFHEIVQVLHKLDIDFAKFGLENSETFLTLLLDKKQLKLCIELLNQLKKDVRTELIRDVAEDLLLTICLQGEIDSVRWLLYVGYAYSVWELQNVMVKFIKE